MFGLTIGFLLFSLFMVFRFPSILGFTATKTLFIGLFVLIASMLFSTTSELLPIQWRKLAIALRIASLLTMFLSFAFVWSFLSSIAR